MDEPAPDWMREPLEGELRCRTCRRPKPRAAFALPSDVAPSCRACTHWWAVDGWEPCGLCGVRLDCADDVDAWRLCRVCERYVGVARGCAGLPTPQEQSCECLGCAVDRDPALGRDQRGAGLLRGPRAEPAPSPAVGVAAVRAAFDRFWAAVENYDLEGTHDLTHPVIDMFMAACPGEALPGSAGSAGPRRSAGVD